MKLVLDLAVQLIKNNPNEEECFVIKNSLLNTLISIVIGRSTKPVAKSAIKTLDHFLTKGIFTLDDIRSSYVSYHPHKDATQELEVWRGIMDNLFHWMRLHYVCPTAGKLIVCLYLHLRQRELQAGSGIEIVTNWRDWLLEFVTKEPSLLESVKNYIFLPFFTANKKEALCFLQMVDDYKTISVASSEDVDASALLYLAALETGKKVGLVEEPGM